MKPQSLAFVVWLVAPLALGGCADVRLYDQSKADVSTAVKTKYAEADILGTIEVQKINLDALLAEELKVVRENHQLQVDFSLLELADNDSPMADTWYDEIDVPLEQLGVASDPKGLRTYIMGLKENTLRSREMADFRLLISLEGVQVVPPCKQDTELPEPNEWTPRGIFEKDTIQIIRVFFGHYKDACDKMKASIQTLLFGGKVADAKQAGEKAKTDQQTRQQRVENLKTEVERATAKHMAAAADAKAAGKKGEEFENAIKERADKLTSALESATAVAPEILSEKRFSSIVTLLKATAGEQTTVEEDPDLATAVVLVGDRAGFWRPVGRARRSVRDPAGGAEIGEQDGRQCRHDQCPPSAIGPEQRGNYLAQIG